MKPQLVPAFVALVVHAVALALPNSSCAAPIQVNFTLTVDTVDQAPLPDCASAGEILTFGCNNAIGDTYVGSFMVDDSILAGDGLLTGIPVSDFFLQIGDVIWSQNPVPNNQFSGFRGLDLFAPGPGLVVSGGALVDLAGGVFGSGDIPFVDFFIPGFTPNRFSANDGLTSLQGCLAIGVVGSACLSVPESGTLALFGIGLLGLGFTRRRTAA
jgi:PEP-CTERM motif